MKKKDKKKYLDYETVSYGDGFPESDNPNKRDDTTSKDPSRPFDSGRKNMHNKKYNHSGTTMNDANAFKNK